MSDSPVTIRCFEFSLISSRSYLPANSLGEPGLRSRDGRKIVFEPTTAVVTNLKGVDVKAHPNTGYESIFYSRSCM